MLTNRRLSAGEAVDWGLANRVVADDELMAEAEKLAANLSSGPTLAYGRVKALLNDTFSHGLETQMELESANISGAAKSEDAIEGINAFLQKRKPEFMGR
jgi:2-(1,2-epoxy-1,2-dihydrophenyl)acetyl-CoA isomerase